MAWGAIISAGVGAATSLFGASEASKSAKRQEGLQREAMAQQRIAQDRQFDMADRAFDYEIENNQYRQAVEALNREIENENFGFANNELRQYQRDVLAERTYDIERQIRLDQDAARQRADQLQQRANNQQLSQSERERALQELEEAQAIARGERIQDLRQFYETQVTMQAEQDYMRDQYEGALSRASDERAYDMRFRDDLISRIDGMSGALREAQSSLGPTPELTALTPDAIDAEIARRQTEYQSDVDRAADRVASVGEAGLIARGVDDSTTGTAERGRIAERLAAAYQDARNRAYEEATGYITGRVGALNDNAERRFGRRGQVLAETANVEGAGIDQLMSLPGLSSTVDATQFAGLVDSAAYDRGIVSAGDYRAPLNVNSSIYDRIQPGSGVGQNLPVSSAAVRDGMNLRRQIVAPFGATNPASATSPFLSSASASAGNAYSTASNNANGAINRSGEAWGSFGSNLRDLFDEGFSAWNDRERPREHTPFTPVSNWGNSTISVPGTVRGRS